MRFEEKLRLFIKERYRHIAEISKVLNVSTTQLSLYLNGKAKPSYQVLKGLADLDCDMNWLLKEAILDQEPRKNENVDELIRKINIIREVVK
jgi:transcriptional regulator with XRE-family HTH domain